MTNSSSILHLDQTSAIPIIFFLVSIKKTNDNLSLSICKNIFVLSTLLSSPTSCLTRQLSTCGRSSKTLDMFLFDLMANDNIFFTAHIHNIFSKVRKKRRQISNVGKLCFFRTEQLSVTHQTMITITSHYFSK